MPSRPLSALTCVHYCTSNSASPRTSWDRLHAGHNVTASRRCTASESPWPGVAAASTCLPRPPPAQERCLGTCRRIADLGEHLAFGLGKMNDGLSGWSY
ncbi:hypothetical protein PYCCODRAFT_1432062 [Trametes coccinea BRFM310]|uniref:Uncharacterized protein n=1 Tax=Trametes coccinea (strain BRFM310) TaxID=1353009 RepID=A0A1Y2IYL4_TRAC3|nr:hypothetical protein PYCCODRAFT_1432062 [Trametes coccinea BRFM310]